MKWYIFSAAVFFGVPVLAALWSCCPRARTALMSLLIGSTVVTVSVNFVSTAGYRGPDRGYEVTVTDLLALSVAGGLLASGWKKIRWLPFNSLPMAAYFLIACISATGSPAPLLASFTISKLVKGFLLYWTVYNAFRSASLYQSLWWAIVSITWIEFVCTIWQKYLWGLYRIYGTFEHSNTIPAYFYPLLATLLAWTIHGGGLNKLQQTVSLVTVLAMCFCIVCTMSRAGALLMTLLLVAVLAGTVGRGFSLRACGRSLLMGMSLRKLGVAAFISGLLMFGAVRAADSYIDRFLYAPESSKQARDEFNHVADVMASQYFWGVGPNNFSFAMSHRPEYRQYMDLLKGEEQAGVCHHIYKLTAAEMGYVGLFAYLVIMGRFGWKTFCSMWGPPTLERHLSLGLLMGLAAFHAGGLLEWVFRITPVFNIFLIISAIGVAIAESHQRDRLPWRRLVASLLSTCDAALGRSSWRREPSLDTAGGGN